VETGDPADRCDLAAPEGVEVRWIDRAERRLWDELATLEKPEGAPYVWVAAERDMVRQARQHFREAWGLPSDRQYFSAYWVR
jgi:NADPH-dependent ferric siderophore reductase